MQALTLLVLGWLLDGLSVDGFWTPVADRATRSCSTH
jgi:hypothetical protein